MPDQSWSDLDELFSRCLRNERDADAGPPRYDAPVRMKLEIAAGSETATFSFGPSNVPEATLSCFRHVTEARLFRPQTARAATIVFDVDVHRE
jgi:hypothetical protein